MLARVSLATTGKVRGEAGEGPFLFRDACWVWLWVFIGTTSAANTVHSAPSPIRSPRRRKNVGSGAEGTTARLPLLVPLLLPLLPLPLLLLPLALLLLLSLPLPLPQPLSDELVVDTVLVDPVGASPKWRPKLGKVGDRTVAANVRVARSRKRPSTVTNWGCGCGAGACGCAS